EVVVIDELVAVRDQQVRRRVLDADADHVLRVLAQLRDERREVGIAADDDERVDVRFRIAEIERVDDHADVGRVLARLAHVRDLDQLERRLVHRRLERLVALPVAVRLLDHDAALQQQPLEHLADVELLVVGVAHAEGDVLEIAEQRHAGHFWGIGHRVPNDRGRFAAPREPTRYLNRSRGRPAGYSGGRACLTRRAGRRKIVPRIACANAAPAGDVSRRATTEVTMGLLDGVLGSVLGGMTGNAPAQGSSPLLRIALQILQQNGGVQGVLAKAQQAGYGEQVQSWIGTGANLPIDAGALTRILGRGQLGEIAQQLGLSHEEAAGQVAAALPGVVDSMTPDGTIPEGHSDLLNQALA